MDSLQQLLLHAKDDTSQVNSLNALAWEYILAGKYDTSMVIAARALSLAKKLDYKKGEAFAYNQTANALWYTGKYLEAAEQHKIALQIRSSLQDKEGIWMSLGNLGLCYRNQSDYPRALQYYFEALKMAESLHSDARIATSLNRIGIVYDDIGDLPNSVDYYKRALLIAEKLQDKPLLVRLNGNIGVSYKKMGEYGNALRCYRTAYALAEVLNDRRSACIQLGNSGIVYALLAERSTGNARKSYFDSAEVDIKKALKIAEALKNKDQVSHQLGSLGQLYIQLGRFPEAASALERSLAIAQEMGALDLIADNYFHLSILDSLTHDPRSGLGHYREYIRYRDSISNDENTRKQTRLEMQYAFDKKEALTQSEQEKKNAVSRIIIYSTGAGLALVLLLAAFIFRGYRQKQKANRIIVQQKKEVEKQKQAVEEKQKDILDSIHYARRIQRSLLPTERYIHKKLSELNT
jgi:tetratricopeptide (TPR) repeat protein